MRFESFSKIHYIYKKVEWFETLVGKFLFHFIILLPNFTTDKTENEVDNNFLKD